MATDDEIIKTVLEFITVGDKQAEESFEKILKLQDAVKKSNKELRAIYSENVTEIEKLSKKYTELATSIDKGNKTQSVREEFVKTKEAIKSTTDALGGVDQALKSTDKILADLSGAAGVAGKSINELKDAQKTLKKEFETAKIGTKQYEDLSKNLIQVGSAIKQVTEAEKDKAKTFAASANSIDALRKKVGDLTKEWKSLDRSTPEFKARASELALYTEELKKAEQEVGIFNRSVGDYKTAITGLNAQIGNIAPSLSGAVQPLKNVTDGFAKLAATPLLATITILVSTFQFIIDAFKKTAEGQEKLNILFGAFNGIVQVVHDTLSDLGEFIVSIFTKPEEAWHNFKKNVLDIFSGYLQGISNLAFAANKAVQGIFSEDARKEAEIYFEQAQEGFRKMIPLYDKINQKINESIEIAKLESKIRRDDLEEIVLIAQKEDKIAQLRAESVNKEKYTLESRLAMLEEALNLENELLALRLEGAREDLQLQEMKNALGKSSLEDLEKEAKLRAEVFKVEREYFDSTRKLKKQLADFEAQERIAAQQEQQKINDAYIKSLADVYAAEKEVAKATADGRQKDFEVYSNDLLRKQDKLKEALAANVKLTEEEQYAIELATYEHEKNINKIKEDAAAAEASARQKAIEEYTNAELTRYNIEQQLQASRDVEQRRLLAAKLKETEELVKKQTETLKKYNVEAEQIPIYYVKTFTKAQESTAQALQKSLETIRIFSGDALGAFGSFSSGLSGLISSAFELSQVKEKWGDDLEGMAEDAKAITKEIATLAASASLSLNKAISTTVSEGFTRQLEASKKFHVEQSRLQKIAQDQERKNLENSLKAQGVSQGKYQIELFKLEEQQEKARIELKRREANEQYEIQLKQFRVKQAQDAISAIIATALGVTAQLSIPIAGIGLAATVGALGAAQVAAIYAQQPPAKPQFAEGGYLPASGMIQGASHSGGGVPISVGGTKVAEAEGAEGAIFVSKKAMQNPAMQSLFSATLGMNAALTKGARGAKYADGGFLDFNYFVNKAREESKGKRKKYRKEEAIQEEAKRQYENYRQEQIQNLYAQESAATASVNAGIAGSSQLASLGVSNITQYEQKIGESTTKKDELEAKIKAEKDYADARIEQIKQQLKYDEKTLEFDKKKKTAQEELSATTLALNKKNLEELRKSNRITEEEYQQLFDQIKLGYGATSQDIIEIKRKEVEETKAAIKQDFDFQKQALADMRQTWKADYSALTKDALNNLDDASKYIDQLTGIDLERYQAILKISEDTKKLNEDYKKNEAILTDGNIQSREETKRLREEQKRIQEEIKAKEKEQAEAKKQFEEERKKNEAAALSAYELANKDAVLATIQAQAEVLKIESEKWTIDKEITAQYNQQIAAQDQIIANMQSEYDQAQLLHDQKLANIKAEEDALKNSFESQKAAIEAAYTAATANMQAEVADLNATILAIKAAGVQAGVDKYENMLNSIAEKLKSLPKFAEGGAIQLGTGIYQGVGPTDRGAGAGIPLFVGNTPIAKIGGGEKMLILNDKASVDPRAIALEQGVSALNNYYNLGVSPPPDSFEKLDYEELAKKITEGMVKSINNRPINAYITNSEVEKSVKNNLRFKKNIQMR